MLRSTELYDSAWMCSPLNPALSRLGNIYCPSDFFRAIPAAKLITKNLKEEIASRKDAPL
jgi:hypothetical protein